MNESTTVLAPLPTPKELDRKWAALLFAVRRSMRYHNHRRKFFDSLSVWTDFLIIISGGAVVSFASSGEAKSWWTIVFGAAVAILAALDLVIGFSMKARDYYELARDFSGLEIAMQKIGDDYTKENFTEIYNRRLEIEQNEPPIKRVLDIFCHNELCLAMGKPKWEQYDIPYWKSQRWMQFLDIGANEIKLYPKPKDES